MRVRIAAPALAAVLLFASAPRASATTWFPKEFECPVCHTKNTFMVVGSYGSYIYHWESKFQFIYWPYTDGAFVYTCKKCRLSAYMWDFEKTPKEKHADILKRLEGVKLDYAKPEGGYEPRAEYLRIPMTQRLLAAQRVYEVLGDRDDDFWCEFYRTLGYHYEAEKKQAEADEARRRALDLAVRMLGDKANEGRRKELLYTTGAMRHFLRDDAGALKDFREALPLVYSSKELEGDKAKGYDAYLTELLREYIKKLGGNEDEKRPAA
jgi:hypothetical protein